MYPWSGNGGGGGGGAVCNRQYHHNLPADRTVWEKLAVEMRVRVCVSVCVCVCVCAFSIPFPPSTNDFCKYVNVTSQEHKT